MAVTLPYVKGSNNLCVFIQQTPLVPPGPGTGCCSGREGRGPRSRSRLRMSTEMRTDRSAQGRCQTRDAARVGWEKLSRAVSGFVGDLRIPRPVSDTKPRESLGPLPGLLMGNLGARYSHSGSFKAALTSPAAPGYPVFSLRCFSGWSQASRVGLASELVTQVDPYRPRPPVSRIRPICPVTSSPGDSTGANLRSGCPRVVRAVLLVLVVVLVVAGPPQKLGLPRAVVGSGLAPAPRVGCLDAAPRPAVWVAPARCGPGQTHVK